MEQNPIYSLKNFLQTMGHYMAASYSKSGGFTLIELVVVIVILGILAATALPKFVDLSSEATAAKSAAVAGANAEAENIKLACEKVRGAGHTSCAQ